MNFDTLSGIDGIIKTVGHEMVRILNKKTNKRHIFIKLRVIAI